MPGIASATGLLAARVHPVYRPKPKRVELSGSGKPAPFTLRPFAGLFNPYPYGCSVLCNHPADCEAKEVVRRAKDSWATEGRALLLPEEVEMIKTSLMTAVGGPGMEYSGNSTAPELANVDAIIVPEELFRKYTETDSRPLTPAPTLASGPALTQRPTPEDRALTCCNPRERTTLVLDLRADQQGLENETFTWHALTLEPPPTPRKCELVACKATPRYQPSPSVTTPPRPPLSQETSSPPIPEICETSSSRNEEDEDCESGSEEPVIIRRRGKRLRKRKCRRGSTYGQQTEVRDPLDPPETQISQIGDGSRRPSTRPGGCDVEDSVNEAEDMPVPAIEAAMTSSFLSPEILKHLCRELDREKVDSEFSLKRKIAYEEALRVKENERIVLRGTRKISSPAKEAVPRVYSRQSARFELLDSDSLRGLTPLDYLSSHVSITSGRKLIFGRAFNRFSEETLLGKRHMLPADVDEAFQEVIGRSLTSEEHEHLKNFIGDIKDPLAFRTWCGLCAVIERLFCPLPQKEVDPPDWLERADFEALERRLEVVEVNLNLSNLLREIRKI